MMKIKTNEGLEAKEVLINFEKEIMAIEYWHDKKKIVVIDESNEHFYKKLGF